MTLTLEKTNFLCSRFFGICLLALFLLSTSDEVEAKSPAQKMCGRTKAKARRVAIKVLAKARKGFPKLKLDKPMGRNVCHCRSPGRTPPCRTNVIHFKSFWHRVKGLNIRAKISLLAYWGRRGLDMRPFTSLNDVRRRAANLRADPLFSKVFAGKTAYCDNLSCCREQRALPKPYSSCPSQNMASAGEIQLAYRQKADKSGKHLDGIEVSTYALPSSRLPPDAPGWALAREMPEVKEWIAENPNYWVSLNSWQRAFLVLTEEPGSKEGLTVLFKKNKYNQNDVTEVLLARPGTSCTDCFERFEGEE